MGAGAALGGGSANAVQGGLNAEGAVENNNAAVILKNEKVRKVAAPAAWQGVRTVGVPAIVGVLCLSDSDCSDAGNAFMEAFDGEAEKTRHILGMGNSNGNNGSNAGASSGSGAAAGAPMPPDDNNHRKSESKTNSQLDNILNHSTRRSHQNSLSQYDRNITQGQSRWELANKDFDSLNPKEIRSISTKYGSGRVGVLPDGRIVNVRPGSSNGQVTLEIQSKTSNMVIKIRY